MTDCGAGHFCVPPYTTCPVIAAGETTCCPPSYSTCDSIFGPDFPNQCCPSGYTCCEGQDSNGTWFPYCDFPYCDYPYSSNSISTVSGSPVHWPFCCWEWCLRGSPLRYRGCPGDALRVSAASI